MREKMEYKSVVNQKKVDAQRVTNAIYYTEEDKRPIVGVLFIDCPFCGEELLLLDDKPVYCKKCRKEISAIYMLDWRIDAKKSGYVYHLVEIYCWQPKSYKKRDIDYTIVFDEKEIIGRFTIKQRHLYKDEFILSLIKLLEEKKLDTEEQINKLKRMVKSLN